MIRTAARHRSRSQRRAAAAVEMAFLAPLLVFLMLIAVDFARIFYKSLTLANCARNGALWESDPYYRAASPYKTVTEAALADADNLYDPERPPRVTTGSGVDDTGKPYVEVTVSQRFKTVSRLPFIPADLDVIRTVRMANAPLNPN